MISNPRIRLYRVFLLALVPIVLCVMMPTAVQAYTPGSVQVIVKDYDSGARLPGATVAMEPGGYTGVTGAGGGVTFTGITPYRNYTVEVTLGGYVTGVYGEGRTGLVWVETGQTTRVTVPIQQEAAISGQITSGGSPLDGALVVLQRERVGASEGGGGLQYVTGMHTAADGNYAFPSVAPGDYTLTAVADSYYLTSTLVSVAAGGALTRDFDLAPGVTSLTFSVLFLGKTYNAAVVVYPLGVTQGVDYQENFLDVTGVPAGGSAVVEGPISFVPSSAGTYTCAVMMVDMNGVGKEVSQSKDIVDVAASAWPSVIPGPSELPLLYNLELYAGSDGTNNVHAGETVYLRGWGKDVNRASPALYNPDAPMFDIYGNKNGDWSQSAYSFEWSLRDGSGADQTVLLNATTDQNVFFTVPPGATVGQTYIATLRVTGDGSTAGEPAEVSVVVATDLGNMACSFCHADVDMTYLTTVHSTVAVGCEDCHGPGSQHLGDVTQITATHWPGNCGRCHDQFAQWQKSRHSDPLAFGHGEISSMLIDNCYKCHYSEGFIAAVESGEDFGTYEAPAGVVVPVDTPNVSCDVCHDPHEQSLENLVGIRTGSEASLCVTCHEKKWQNATYTAQGDIIGNAYHWADYSQYQGAGNQHRMPKGCVTCHMSKDVSADDALGVRKVGGHTLRMRDVGADGNPGTADDVLNIAVCQGCHAGLTTFDRNGVQSRIKTKLKRLGWLLTLNNHDFLPPFQPGTCSTCHRGGTLPFKDDTEENLFEHAYTNYKLILHDRSFGIHNPGYIERLLDDSIALVEEVTVAALSSFHAEPLNNKVRVTWTTESETDNAGFHLYRAESPDGEYTRLNSALIPARGTPTQGWSYEFTDHSARNRQTYYYKLEDVDVRGTVSSHGPAVATPRLLYLMNK